MLRAGIDVWIIQLAPAWTVSVLQNRSTNVLHSHATEHASNGRRIRDKQERCYKDIGGSAGKELSMSPTLAVSKTLRPALQKAGEV